MVRVVILRPGVAPEITEIEDGLKAMQQLVGGYLDAVRIAPRLFAHFREDGRQHDLAPTAFVDHLADTLVGTVVIGAMDDNGDARSITDDEIEEALRLVTPVTGNMTRGGSA